LTNSASELDALGRVEQRFPDLGLHVDRWRRERYMSPSANAICTSVDVGHSCGCCPDSPLEAWPFVVVEGLRVYASGIPYTVGEGHWNGGDVSDRGWQERLRKDGIPEAVVGVVASHFADNPPEPDEDEAPATSRGEEG
jgi:hypothetical protein